MKYKPLLSYNGPTSVGQSKRVWSSDLFDFAKGQYPGDAGYPDAFTTPLAITYPRSTSLPDQFAYYEGRTPNYIWPYATSGTNLTGGNIVNRAGLEALDMWSTNLSSIKAQSPGAASELLTLSNVSETDTQVWTWDRSGIAIDTSLGFNWNASGYFSLAIAYRLQKTNQHEYTGSILYQSAFGSSTLSVKSGSTELQYLTPNLVSTSGNTTGSGDHIYKETYDSGENYLFLPLGYVNPNDITVTMSCVSTYVYGNDGSTFVIRGTSGAAIWAMCLVPTPLLSLRSSQNPGVLGQSITFTATTYPVIDSGDVTFYDGGSFVSASALNPSGIATWISTGLTTGDHTITATVTPPLSAITYTSNEFIETILFSASFRPTSGTGYTAFPNAVDDTGDTVDTTTSSSQITPQLTNLSYVFDGFGTGTYTGTLNVNVNAFADYASSSAHAGVLITYTSSAGSGTLLDLDGSTGGTNGNLSVALTDVDIATLSVSINLQADRSGVNPDFEYYAASVSLYDVVFIVG